MLEDPPKENSPAEDSNQVVNVTADGKIRKVVLKEGNGNVPPLHSHCLVHYKGRVIQSGEIFMDSVSESESKEPVKVVAGRDAVMKGKGLNLLVASMSVGETCLAWVSPEYGYGEQGNFSFPTIPPSADLSYSVELLDFEPPKQDSDGSLTYEERLEASQRRRLDGNTLFAAQQYEEALSKYNAALSFINDDFMMQLHDFHFDRALQERLPSLLNAAACQIKLERYHEVISLTTQVLSMDRNNSKAFFRRGVARAALGQSEPALEDLRQASAASPGDAKIKQEMAKVLHSIREQRQAEAALFKNAIRKAEETGGLYEDEEEKSEYPDYEYPTPHTSGITWWMRMCQRICPWMFRSKPTKVHTF